MKSGLVQKHFLYLLFLLLVVVVIVTVVVGRDALSDGKLPMAARDIFDHSQNKDIPDYICNN
jgi:hypothetical protein